MVTHERSTLHVSLGKPLVNGEEDKALRAVFVGSQPEVDC
jgi:hypothetical protein